MLVGLIILLIGVIYLINEMNFGFKIEFDLIWPLLVMLFSFGTMIKHKKFSFWYSLFGFIGFWYTLYYFNILKVSISDFLWPLILITMGLAIINSKITWDQKVKDAELTSGTIAKDGRLNFNGIFGGVEETINLKDFKGCVANGIFGGVELDLRKVEIKENVTIDANSIFGGIDLTMPEDYNVVVNSFAIFGGNDNKIKREFDEKKKTIYVNCVSIFGGTDIK